MLEFCISMNDERLRNRCVLVYKSKLLELGYPRLAYRSAAKILTDECYGRKQTLKQRMDALCEESSKINQAYFKDIETLFNIRLEELLKIHTSIKKRRWCHISNGQPYPIEFFAYHLQKNGVTLKIQLIGISPTRIHSYYWRQGPEVHTYSNVDL